MEIKPQELRIGNWVKWGDDEVQWEHGHWLGVFKKNYGYPDAIELTPEWLTLAGLEKLNVSGFVISGATYWRRKGITIYEIEGKYMLPIGENLGDTTGRTVIQFDKLHELQNIFALTGEELAIDKTSLKN